MRLHFYEFLFIRKEIRTVIAGGRGVSDGLGKGIICISEMMKMFHIYIIYCIDLHVITV